MVVFSNPLEVMEQMTYLLFIRRLDEIQITKERKANRLKITIEKPVFKPEQDHARMVKVHHFRVIIKL